MSNLRMNQAKGKYYMLILDPNNAESQTMLAYNTKKGHFIGNPIDLDAKKVYNPSSLKYLLRVELHTIVEEDLTRGSCRDPSRNQAHKVEAQLRKIMYGEESVVMERKKEGRKVGHTKRKRSTLNNRKTETKYAKRRMMDGASAKSERDEEAEEEDSGSHSSMGQVEAEEGQQEDSE